MDNVPTTINSTAPPCIWNVSKNYMGRLQNYWLLKQTSGKPPKYYLLDNNVLYCLITDNGLLEVRERMKLEPIKCFIYEINFVSETKAYPYLFKMASVFSCRRFPLYVSGSRDVAFHIPLESKKKEVFRYNVRLPPYVTCTQCVIQWTYYTGKHPT
jgi:hypothetical protein